MRVSEISTNTVVSYGRIEPSAEDVFLIETLFIPAAVQYIQSQTGMTPEEMDEKADVAVAVCALCLEMYDNRSVSVDSDKVSKVVADVIGQYNGVLLPTEDA